MTAYKTAQEARCEILDLADLHGHQSVIEELVRYMSGDDCRDFIEHFKTFYSDY